MTFAFSALGQVAYEGMVFDFESGAPMDAVLVRSTNDSSNGTLTDENGNFRITANSNEFSFTHSGYKELILKLSTTSLNHIHMEHSLGYLDQVVVSGSKSEKKIKELTVSLDIIQPDLVQKKNVIKAENVLQQVSSLSVTDKQVNIRNSSGWSYGAGSRVMVLQDGMPMLSGDAGQAQWTFINTDYIQNIEVLKGASSLLYGSSALGGIIHIQTALPQDSSLTRFQAYVGAYSKGKRDGLEWTPSNLFQSGVRLLNVKRFDKLDVVSNLQLIQDDGYRMGDFESRLRAGTLLKYKLSDSSRFQLNAQVMTNRTASFLLWESYDSAYTALDGDYTQNRGFRFIVDPKWTKYHKHGKQLVQARYFRIVNDIESQDTGNDQSNSSNVYYAEYQWHQRFSGLGLKTILGAVLQQTTSNSPLFQGDHRTTNQAAFLQLEKKLGPVLLITGVRYERYTLDSFEESKPVFRAGFNWPASPSTVFRASFGQGYRFPTIAEAFIKTNVGALAIFPNPDLQSESGQSIEFGIKQGWAKNEAKGFVDLAFFEMRYDNMMEFTFSQWGQGIEGLGFKSINVGKTQIRGVELSGAAEIPIGSGRLKCFGGYTYSLPISLEPDKVVASNYYNVPLSYDSTSSDHSNNILKYRYRHLVRLDVQYDIKQFQFGLSTRYNSYMENIDRAFVDFPINLFVFGIEESRNVNPNGDLLFDFRCSYTFRNSEIALNILNLLNEEFVSRPADLGPPRYSNISYKLEF